jgi:hypothetical protein
MKLSNALAIYSRDLRKRMSAAAILIMSLAVLIAPAKGVES